MFTVRRFLSCAPLLLSLAVLAGCESVFNYQPQETRSGFTVLVDVPGQPDSARVVADIGAFARRRGFVRQGAMPTPTPTPDPAAPQPPPPAPERYLLGKITLEIIRDSDHSRVDAYLHSFSHQLSRKFADDFYRDFQRQYAASYGGEGIIVQTDYANESGGLPKGAGRGGKGGGHGGSPNPPG